MQIIIQLPRSPENVSSRKPTHLEMKDKIRFRIISSTSISSFIKQNVRNLTLNGHQYMCCDFCIIIRAFEFASSRSVTVQRFTHNNPVV